MGYYSGTQVCSFIVLLLGTAAIIVSLATNFWVVKSSSILTVETKIHSGLVFRCVSAEGTILGHHDSKTGCLNRYSALYEDVKKDVTNVDPEALFKNTDIRHWEFGVLVLMAAAALFGVLSLLTAPCCCHKCGCCQGCLVLWSAVTAVAGIIVFVVFTEQGKEPVSIIGINIAQPEAMKSNYSWSFFVAVGGALLQSIASLMFCLGRGRSHAYTQQI
jgi:hypothetical protein